MNGDAFEIAASKGQLSLCGANDRGTIYAVYSYLEKYIGWRWFNFDTEIIKPKISRDIYAGEVHIEEPVFGYRNCRIYDSSENIDFFVKLKQNDSRNFGLPDDMGGGIAYRRLCHTFNDICSPKVYFDEHPEYFALRDGKRVKRQLCLTNPDVLRIATENVFEQLRTQKAHIIAVSQNDNCDYCTCDKCRAVDEEEGGPTGTMLRFVNAIAEAVEKEFPDVTVMTLAYQYTRHLPKITRPRPNVGVLLCSYECCFRHPLNDEMCEMNTGFVKDINEWRSITDNLYIFDYVTDFSHYTMPLPNISSLRDNMRFFADHSVKGVLSLGAYNGRGADFSELKAYLISKLLWNPYMSAEEYE